MKRASSAFLVLLLLMIAGCTRSDHSASSADFSDRKIRIVATTSIIGDLVQVIGGERVSVASLMGPGVDPHLYKASEGDVRRMSDADVIFYNGLHLEGKMTDVFEQMHRRGKHTVPLAELAIPDSLLRESPDFAGNYDPHVWFSVPHWMMVAEHLTIFLAEVDSAGADYYRQNERQYREALQEVDDYITRRLTEVDPSRRVLITSHDAFGYFGTTYDFEVRGLQGLSTASEAGTSDVQELAEFVAQRQIPAIFLESSVPQRGIEAVREAVRARGFDVRIGGTLYGDALGPAGSGADTYVGMVRSNVETIVSGLGERGAT